MAKNKTIFVCSECGNESSKWLGKCPACQAWNSFYEQKIVETKNKEIKDKTKSIPQKLNSYEAKETLRINTGFNELNRVLGGGLVKGSLVLLGGEPGIGKSTLILQICDKIKGDGKVLYVSGEESAEQIKLRADRLNINNEDILFLGIRLLLHFLDFNRLFGKFIYESQNQTGHQSNRKNNQSVFYNACYRALIFLFAHLRSPPFPKAFGHVIFSIKGTIRFPMIIA